MLIKYKEEPEIFIISRGASEYIYAKYYDTALILLERTMYSAIILLLVQYKFQNHWSDGKHNAKVQTVN